MENTAGYKFTEEVHPSARLVMLHLWSVASGKRVGSRAVTLAPSHTFSARLDDARAIVAWNADVRKCEVLKE